MMNTFWFASIALCIAIWTSLDANLCRAHLPVAVGDVADKLPINARCHYGTTKQKR
jgi:hypothetical protein